MNKRLLENEELKMKIDSVNARKTKEKIKWTIESYLIHLEENSETKFKCIDKKRKRKIYYLGDIGKFSNKLLHKFSKFNLPQQKSYLSSLIFCEKQHT